MSTLNFMSIFGIDIINGLRLLCAWLCEAIYMLIAGLYELFMNISRVELLTSEQIHPIYQRITMILTIVMVFYVTFETVKFVIQPDQFSDKEKGASKIVVRMVLVVLLIAFVPQIFSGAYWVQNKIFDTQVFSKVILGKQNVDSNQFGRNLSYNIFSMFYSLDTESFSESELESKKCGNIPCKQVVLMNYNQLRTEGKLTFLTEGLNEKDKITDSTTGEKIEKYYINFNGLFAVGVGAFIAYMLLLYCVDAGVRVVQLLFLQIIAPIPIMAYLSPKKDGMFEKWTKQCLTTYLDLFLRVGIIYFILLICQILGNAFSSGTLVNNASGSATWLIYIALIMGLLLFAHKAPKMLGELFPKMGAASGNFGLKATERVAPEAARVAGAALGGTRFVGGAISRGVSRHVRNKANNAHAPWTEDGKEQRRERRKHRQRRADARKDIQTAEGMQERVSDEEVTKSKNKVQRAAEAYKNAKGTADEAQKKQDLDKAAAEHRQLMRKRAGTTDEMLDQRKNYAQKRKNLNDAQKELEAAKATNDATKISAAQSKVNQAESEFKKASDDYTDVLKKSKASDSVGQNWASVVSGQANDIIASNKLKDAQKELEDAIAQGDDSKIEAAQKKVDEATKLAESSQQNLQYGVDRYKNVSSGNIDALKTKYDDAQEQIAKDNNERWGSVAGAAVVGAVSGAVTGAKAGFNATKLEEIIPKAKEGWQKDVKNIQALNKYYDDGGAVGVQGLVDRTIAQVEKQIGIETAYERINLENQRIENNIKELDTSIARVDNVKKEFDATEDRIKSKLDDNKVTVSAKTIEMEQAKKAKDPNYAGPKTKSGTLIQLTEGQNYGTINKAYRAKALNAKAISEAASKDAEEKEAKLGANKDAIVEKYDKYSRGEMVGPLTELEQQEYQLYHDYKLAKKNAEEKATESVKADQDARDVEKITSRAIMTEMLNDPEYEKKSGYYDGVAVQSLKRDYNEIKIANQDKELRAALASSTLSQEDYSAFINCRFKDYDQMDRVLVELNNARSALAIKKQTQQDQKNRNISSDTTQSKKAANDYNGGSGK